jgi:hypothetical protein
MIGVSKVEGVGRAAELSRGLAKRDQIPGAVRHRCLMAQDVVVAVLGAHFVPGIIRPVPLIEHFLDLIFIAIDAKQRRSFLRAMP